MRLPDWHSRLSDYIDAVRQTPFAYGSHDCALFAAGAVEAITGVDPSLELRGKYKTLMGGLRQLKKLGFADHGEFAASLFEEVHPSHAQIGDIASIDLGGGAIALGVVQGSRIFVLRPDVQGMATVDLLTASKAFRV
ncbi:hypothetical protein [Rhizobium sp. Root1204]|uniref:DUF6950 family protein n=1 Tax=Rhizobium sp. Root1204 TaxID=1736428 RepID=UPI0007147EFE|nr:hypothetical protein [Rhizobium sp. Root1204]KQV31153.1 hypothetical protein ASC96_08150 [Rhizobium sp. Root1204]